MEEQKHSNAIDNPETIPPSTNSPTPHSPPADVHDEIGSTSRNSSEPDEKMPGLAQRLAEAFREGFASTKPDYEKRPDVRIPPPARKNRQQSDDAGILDRVSQEGISAAAIVGDKAASAVDAVFQLVKKAPAMTQKYAEAFREGASSVKPREDRERRQELPPSAKKNWLPSGGGAILDRVFQAGGSAAEIVRGAVAALKPGEVGGAGHKICMCKKKIDNLYIAIGREAVNSWDNGSIETEKISALLDELRKNEEEVRNLQEQIAEAAAARKTETSGRRQAAKETVLAPISDKEDIDFAVGVSDGKPDGQVYHPGDRQQQERPDGVYFAVAETSASAAPEAEYPASPPAPEDTVAAEAAPREEVIDDGSDQAMPEEPKASRKKPDGRPPGKGRRGGIAPSERKRGRGRR